MRVRPARPEDAAAVAEIQVRTWQVAYEHIFGGERLARLSVEGRRPWWERSLAAAGAAVAEDDGGRVVGFVSTGPDRDDERVGELYAIYVLPDAWGTGAGPRLMDAAKAMLAQAHEEAVLWVLDDNPRARRFYEREGWAPDGTTKTDEFLGVSVAEVRYRIGLVE